MCSLPVCLNAAMSKQTNDDEVSSSHGPPVEEAHIGNRGSSPKAASAVTRVPYVNLFKNNRLINENQKMIHYPSGSNTLTFGFDDIDIVQKTYGICFAGLRYQWQTTDCCSH